jgi:chromosomal replication initiation ATPase DnaA
VSNNGKEIASALQKTLADRIGEDRFELWFGNEVTLALREVTWKWSVSDGFQLEQIRRRFTADLEAIGLASDGNSGGNLVLRVREPGERAFRTPGLGSEGWRPRVE